MHISLNGQVICLYYCRQTANLYLYSQVSCPWACNRYVDTDDDNVRKTGPNPNYEGPGQRERQHCVHA